MIYASQVINPAHTLNSSKATKTTPHIDGLKKVFVATNGVGFKPFIEAPKNLDLDLTDTGVMSIQKLVLAMRKAKGELIRYINNANLDTKALRNLLNKHTTLNVV